METSNTTDRTLHLTRTINAPVALVWEVWQPEHIVKWWGPDGFTNTIKTMDIVPGGEWDFVMHGPDGTDYVNKATFKEVIVNEKIVFEHYAPNFIATITFEAQGDKTLLNWHMLFETAELFIQVVQTFKADEGLKQNIDKLEVYLAGLK
jgi:uncharacterized protein YndB with AHSA1/START domain